MSYFEIFRDIINTQELPDEKKPEEILEERLFVMKEEKHLLFSNQDDVN